MVLNAEHVFLIDRSANVLSGRIVVAIRSLAVVCLCFGFTAATFVDAAVNRKAAVEIVKGITADYVSGGVTVALSDVPDSEDPGLFVGDPISFKLASDDALYYLMVMVDPKGTAVAIFPDFAITDTPQPYQTFAYPPEGTGELTQQEPVGIETVFLFASGKPVNMTDFGFPMDSDIHVIGDEEESLTAFVENANILFAGKSVRAAEYRYFVDYPDLQYGTRAVRRELKSRIEQVNVLAEGEKLQAAVTSSNKREISGTASQQTGVIQSEALAVNDIRFETNSDDLTIVGKTQLDVFGSELVSILEESPNIDVFLEGHTDDTGPSEYNQNLSERRAASAKRYLVTEFGIADDRVVTLGKGEDVPLMANTDTITRALNRRVEIRVGVAQ